MGIENSSKVNELLVENFKEAVKAVDTSLLLAFISVVFLLIHGLQDDFAREQNGPASEEIDVPFLGLKAQLLTASLIALTLYFVLTFRAASRVRRAGVIANRLASIDKDILAAVLLYPSVATGGAKAKIASCIALGVLGYGSFFFMYAPMRKQEPGLLLVSALVMLVPPAVLCWQLLAWRVHHVARDAA